ncbi:MAG: phosphoribosyltransferase [Leptolyngbya sp. SIO1E4]|nr:phosphoribosyltransferase [Leptolyngbya sp. SIO1E4]
MGSKFLDRHRAGQILAQQLSHIGTSEPGIVLALPRGGVPIGYEIARALNWPLDIWLVRKLGVPDQPELAMGAIAFPHSQVLNTVLIQKLHVSEAQLEAVLQAEKHELSRRNQCYRQGRALPDIEGKAVILVDDGLATGATMQAAIASLKHYHPATIIIAIPVAAPNSLRQIQAQVDHAICPLIPELMGAISQWYIHFEPVADEEVIMLLERAWKGEWEDKGVGG